MHRIRHLVTALILAALLGYLLAGAASSQTTPSDVTVSGAVLGASAAQDQSAAAALSTTTPIKHLVVIFQENVSFDHYFGTYPTAANLSGESPFTERPGTPSVNGLNHALLTANPNLNNPARLTPHQALTCDMNHDYTAEQKAVDAGLMDAFVQNTQGKPWNSAQYCPPGIVMDYYDGNTVTGLWNYAQHYAMNDNSFGTTFGPSTPGALNLVAGDTSGALCGPSSAVYSGTPCTSTTPAGSGSNTVYGDSDPYFDDCSKGGPSNKTATIAMSGQNIGDLLNARGITWGWFQGGFDNCTVKHPDISYDQLAGINPATDPNTYADYSPHHEPFQYFASTANPHHLPPTSVAMIGHQDQANHQYDLSRFWQAADAGNLPAVSFLKAPAYQDGHAGYSDPLDEQTFLVNTINHLESLPSWQSTAVVINYDDSDGWYDHVMSPILNHSNTTLDVHCGTTTDGAPARCGYGPRLPYLVISPWARTNYVDNTLTDQSSSIRFVEDNWLGGQRVSAGSFDNKAGSIMGMFDFTSQPQGENRLSLDPQTGEALSGSSGFTVSYTSATSGRGLIEFGSGPGCQGLVQTATQDRGSGTTEHTVVVTGNDLPGTIGNIGITPGATYWFEALTVTGAGTEIDNNNGRCYQVSVPRP